MTRAPHISLLLFSLLATCAIVEAALGVLGVHDENQNYHVFGRRLRPYRLPIVTVENLIDEYLASDESELVWDPILGWSPRPNSTGYGDLHRNNAQGIRGDLPVALSAAAGVYRIALFGDSFTYGHEVDEKNSWGSSLGENLRAAGVNAEVLNFGVAGYGMDQAYLRWSEFGRQFEPDLVVFGFQPENAKRNLNLLRPILYYGEKTPFFKPRFVLKDGQLRVVNTPCIAPDRIVETLRSFEEWEEAQHEHYYDPWDYREHFWTSSRLGAFFVGVLLENRFTHRRRLEEFYAADSTPTRLAVRIVESFRREVESKGSDFMVVNLPNERGLSDQLKGSSPRYQPLLERVSQVAVVVDPTAVLMEATSDPSLRDLFEEFLHYSVLGNRLVAGVAARAVLKSDLTNRGHS